MCGEELENATGKTGVEFYLAPVGHSNNVEYKLFIEKNGVYEEVELPTPKGKNPTDNIMRMSENNIDDKTAVSILYIGKDRAITVFDGGPYAEVDIANRDRDGEFSSVNIEKSIEQGKVGYENRELREAGGDTLDARKSATEKRTVFYTMKELDQRDVPYEINPAKDNNGIELYELEACVDGLKAKLREEIQKQLIFEGKREIDANNIAEKMVSKIVDEHQDYNIAKEQAENENEDRGRTPWEDIGEFGHRH